MDGVILSVEDEENDQLFIKLAFEDVELGERVRFVEDGRRAIEYLSGEGEFRDRGRYPLPSLVLLDLRLPQVPGLELLRWIRSRGEYEAMAVVLLSASDSAADVEEGRRLGADDYLVKPVALSGWRELAMRIRNTWMEGRKMEATSWGRLAGVS